MSADRERLRTTFDEAADLYQDARPDYPELLFDRLLELTGLRPGDSVLEVGAGPGKATLPLARRGLRITAVEPGPSLAARARENLRGLPVEVVHSRFEDWSGPWGAYAAVVAATAWHWVDPAIRYRKAHQLLRHGGHLAFWSALHAFPGGFDPFFSEIQEVYDAIGESHPGEWPPPPPDEIPDDRAEIEASGLFDDVEVRRYIWETSYTADEYIALLDTFSGHISMEPAKREHLYREIRRRIGQRRDPRMRRHWYAILHVARSTVQPGRRE